MIALNGSGGPDFVGASEGRGEKRDLGVDTRELSALLYRIMDFLDYHVKPYQLPLIYLAPEDSVLLLEIISVCLDAFGPRYWRTLSKGVVALRYSL